MFPLLNWIEIEVVPTLFTLSRRVGTISPNERCIGTLSLLAKCANGTLSPHERCVDALSPTTKCFRSLYRKKSKVSRPFLKVDEVEDHPYHLGEVAFSSITYGEDLLNSSS